MNAYTTVLCMVAAASFALGCGTGKVPKPEEPKLDDDDPTLSNDAPPQRSLEGQAGLIITSVPEGVEILVDGKSVGKTPVTAEKLNSGEHEVTFMFGGDDRVTLPVSLGEGEYQKVHQSVSPDGSDAQMGE
jgi:hypothetical protein